MSALYLVDASVYVFRAWFSVADRLTDPAGRPANALFGYGMFLCELLERRRPGHIAVAFDESLRSSFRNAIDPQYKANRPPPPQELKQQFARCRALTQALGVSCFASERYEADDLIGSLAARFRPRHPAVIVTSDKDLAQLVERDDRLWDAARDRWLDLEGVRRTFGVEAWQVADLLALMGDAVDNIPGVPGIGAKGAAALLAVFGDLEGLYRRLDEVPALPLRGAARMARLLAEHRETAFRARQLTRIHCQVELACEAEDLAWRGADPQALAGLELPPRLLRRAQRLVAPREQNAAEPATAVVDRA